MGGMLLFCFLCWNSHHYLKYVTLHMMNNMIQSICPEMTMAMIMIIVIRVRILLLRGSVQLLLILPMMMVRYIYLTTLKAGANEINR